MTPHVQAIESLLDFTIIRKIFLWFSVGVFVLIPLDLADISFQSKRIPSELSSLKTKLNTSSLEPLSSYESAFQSSRLFGWQVPQISLPSLGSSIQELVKDFRLKGIVILKEPEAIVQDARTQKNIFVREGDQMGEVTVKEIEQDSIVLSYSGEEIKLRMEAGQ